MGRKKGVPISYDCIACGRLVTRCIEWREGVHLCHECVSNMTVAPHDGSEAESCMLCGVASATARYFVGDIYVCSACAETAKAIMACDDARRRWTPLCRPFKYSWAALRLVRHILSYVATPRARKAENKTGSDQRSGLIDE